MPYGLASPSHYLPPICLSISSICLLHLLLCRYYRFAASADAAAAAASVSPNFRTSQADREICRQRKFQVIRRRCGAGPTVAHRRSSSPNAYVSSGDSQTISRDSRVSTMPVIRENLRGMRIVSSYAVREYGTKKRKVWNVFRLRHWLCQFIPIRRIDVICIRIKKNDFNQFIIYKLLFEIKFGAHNLNFITNKLMLNLFKYFSEINSWRIKDRLCSIC